MYAQILNKTLFDLNKHKIVLAKALLIPFIVLICLELYSKTIIDPQIIWKKMLFVSLISLVVSIYVAITTHRILLLGDDSVPTWGNFKFTSREGYFILKTFILAFMVSIPLVLFSLIGNIFMLVGSVIAVILFSRLSLVFPAVAIDKELTFGDSWKLTKEYKLLTFITIVFVPAVLTLVFGTVYNLAINFLAKMFSSNLSILSVLLDLFITVVIVACLSSTYRFIIDNENIDTQEEKIKEPVRDIEIKRDENTVKTIIDMNHNITFESLKLDLTVQYEPLGFVKTVIDKSDSWMVKNPNQGAAYVFLSIKDNDFVIETYNTTEPVIEIFG